VAKPQAQKTPETYADCVKKDSNYFSLQNGLSAITDSRLGNGAVAGALLGNPIAGGIQLLQDVASLNGRSAITGGLQLGAGDIASALAKYVPNIAVNAVAMVEAAMQTPTMQASGGFSAEISGVLPLGTLAQVGTGALSLFTRTVTLPIRSSVSLFSAAVCGIGR